MIGYWYGVALLNFLVDYLLLLGTNRLCGHALGCGRGVLSAVLGGLYGAICLLPDLQFLGNIYWRFVVLGLMGWIAFGFSKSGLRCTVIFALLSMALGGIAQGIGTGGVTSVILSAIVVLVLCFLGFRDRPGSTRYVPVELSYGEKKLRLTALCDTGNTLTDPITGKPVLVVGAEVAQQLIGLTRQQLCSPIAAMRQVSVPGLRLIPYRSIGQPAGMLLALRIPSVRIGGWQGSFLVAFAPEQLSSDGKFQALTGGAA